MTDLIKLAKEWCAEQHAKVNQLYGDKPYIHHLNMVVDVANRFIHLIPENKREIVISGAYAHDTQEDTRNTFNDVKDVLGEEVAELSYALTNEKGRNRSERANNKYYEGIRNTPYATFIKLCDRIANVEYSKQNGSSMFHKYEKENQHFMEILYDDKYAEMFTYLSNLFQK